MPKYSVRFYSEYCDEYHVEAETPEEAMDLAAEYECHAHSRTADEALTQFAGKVEVVERHAYVGSSDTCISELDADGSWLD
jgi:alkanesulfonate monooxygenase SsuD/methylene tetrahydromethanopterin reductase-like flavin-dependent oxidoreductase (luciferase family)